MTTTQADLDGECTCQQVEVGLPGSGETIPGRRNPKCPVHATAGGTT